MSGALKLVCKHWGVSRPTAHIQGLPEPMFELREL